MMVFFRWYTQNTVNTEYTESTMNAKYSVLPKISTYCATYIENIGSKPKNFIF